MASVARSNGGRARGLQVGEQVPCFLGALEAEVRRALLSLGLRAQDLVGVLNPPPRDPEGELVWEEACVQRDVDREREAFGGGEHELRTGSREVQPLRQGAEHELRLPAATLLGLDNQ